MVFVDPPASPSSADDDPAAFLQSIRDLSAKREREDEQRFKNLEEEVKRQREERAARRAERARSISPEKVNLASNLPEPHSRPNAVRLDNKPAVTLPPTAVSAEMDNSTRAGPPSPTKDIPEFKGFQSARNSTASTSAALPTPEHASQPSQSASSLARSGTLSWQRRPTSRGGSSGPTSVTGTGSVANNRDASVDRTEPSKEQIAASLGSRDPAWFRQTSDPGRGSAAYRKSKEELTLADNAGTVKRALPGMSRETSMEPERQLSPAPSESIKSESVSVRDSARSSRFSTATSNTTPSKPDLKSLIAADTAQHDASPMSDNTSSSIGDQSGLGRTMTMSSSQARLANATERPSSPTKGMGGFVQSAMMKRSDSVNKRWSTQHGASLSRQNSLASARGGYGGLAGSHGTPKLDPTVGRNEASTELPSRPPSSGSNNQSGIAAAQGHDEGSRFVKPALPRHNRSKSVASSYTTTAEDGAMSPPSSPSKRFSPTKSSWIESALTKPESSKPTAPKNAQPSWMANIAKAKAERASAESTPRTGTPKSSEAETSRSGSPSKPTGPFGTSVLKRPDSRDRAPVPSSRPNASDLPAPNANPETPPPTSAPVPTNPIKPANTEPQERGELKSEPLAESTLAQPKESAPASDSAKLNSAAPISKPKPGTPPKPQTDFRSTLRSRPAPETNQQATPEFLSKFGNLRKTQTEKYVAPNIFKDNIMRGKAELTKTGGPVKTPRRDELKESLLAKKEDWKKAKEEGRDLPGQIHERKTSGTPLTPKKPEALAKRELLGQSDNLQAASTPEKSKQPTPEALARHKSLKDKPKVEAPRFKSETIAASTPLAVNAPEPSRQEQLPKQTSELAEAPQKQHPTTSKLAARFNPGLAGMLARGPPTTTGGSNAPSRSESPAVPDRSSAATPEETTSSGPLQDVRKGRAKGPKKRKQGTAASEGPAGEQPAQPAQPEPRAETTRAAAPEKKADSLSTEPIPIQATKQRAPPGYAASIMLASLKNSPKQEETTPSPEKSVASVKSPTAATKVVETPSAASKVNVPEFSGFSSTKKPALTPKADDNKENRDSPLPSVKSAASSWGKQSSPRTTEAHQQIQLPSKKDEEAAMRSAGLLASSSGRPSSHTAAAVDATKSDVPTSPPSAGRIPPKPTKSSRVVSGQLQEASPNKGGPTDSSPRLQAEPDRLTVRIFGSVPNLANPLAIDTRAVISSSQWEVPSDSHTLKRTMQEVSPDGFLKKTSLQEEFTLFDEAVYLCSHTHAVESAKNTEIFIWKGNSAPNASVEQAQALAKKYSRDAGSAPINNVKQSYETPAFLQALGGILVTRRGSRKGATKQYMLCGRKHLGHVTFDEVDFRVESLCSGFVYLISCPATLQQSKLYLWKGSGCSVEEISAARLAAMGLSETGEIIEVDGGAEFASFLKIFGVGTTKASVPKPTILWQQKAQAPDKFQARLFRVQQAEQKFSLLTTLLSGRRSWNSFSSPSRSPTRENENVKVEAKHISPFTQADLEAEGIYLLDAFSELFILVGPLFASQPDVARNAMLEQTLLFTAQYAAIAAEQRPVTIKANVLYDGIPNDLKMLFRHWDDSIGLWGTAGLMAGLEAQGGQEVKMLPLDDVLKDGH